MLVLALALAGTTAAGCGAAEAPLAPTVDSAPTISPVPSPSESLEPSQPTTTSAPTPIPSETETTPCALSPVVVPTAPAEVPGYTQLDESTGLHMTGRVQQIDLQTYRLAVSGKVETVLSLTYDDLRCLPKVSAAPTLVCPGFFEDEATWAGAPLRLVLGAAGPQSGATQVRLVSADGYSAFVPLEEALSTDNFLAYEWEGEPLPILHGFPVRAVFPDLQGNRWVKWLVEIEVH
jgi:DMSO/TMAO reductase YedYZ molybdopterin-dependent catalytic subunit